MGFIKNIWDGVLSFGAFVLTAFIFGVPVWVTYVAVSGGLVPALVYIPLIGMLYVGLNLAIAFLRKALDGVAPLRDRKRR